MAGVAFILHVRRLDARDDINQARADARQIAMFLRDYAHEHGGTLPVSPSALITNDGKYLNSDEFLAYEASHLCTLKHPGAAWERLPQDAVFLELTVPNHKKAIQVYPDLRTTVADQ